MKIQIDFDNKIIKAESYRINLYTLYEKIKQLFPDDEWKEFELETNTTIQYVNPPIVIEPYYPQKWWNDPIWMYDPKSEPYYTVDCRYNDTVTTANFSNLTGEYTFEFK